MYPHAPFHVDLHSRHIFNRVNPAARFATKLRRGRIPAGAAFGVKRSTLDEKKEGHLC